MKKILKIAAALLFCVLSTGTATAQTAKEENMTDNQKILIAYYSWGGNTRQVAQAIQSEIGGDLFEIIPVNAYPEEYRATTTQAKKEINEGYRPALKSLPEKINEYDVVFIGSPNWWGTIAPAVSSFLEQAGLNGKTVIPFITHGGGRAQNTVKDMTSQCASCQVKGDEAWIGYGNETDGLSEWLKKTGYKAE